jgi:hypothetical protein
MKHVHITNEENWKTNLKGIMKLHSWEATKCPSDGLEQWHILVLETQELQAYMNNAPLANRYFKNTTTGQVIYYLYCQANYRKIRRLRHDG